MVPNSNGDNGSSNPPPPWSSGGGRNRNANRNSNSDLLLHSTCALEFTACARLIQDFWRHFRWGTAPAARPALVTLIDVRKIAMLLIYYCGNVELDLSRPFATVPSYSPT